MLELMNIHKSFKLNGTTINVLNGIDILIKPGESVAVIGASGVGKSTLLHIMGTLEPPTKGTVRFEAQNINEMDESDLCRLMSDGLNQMRFTDPGRTHQEQIGFVPDEAAGR